MNERRHDSYAYSVTDLTTLLRQNLRLLRLLKQRDLINSLNTSDKLTTSDRPFTTTSTQQLSRQRNAYPERTSPVFILLVERSSGNELISSRTAFRRQNFQPEGLSVRHRPESVIPAINRSYNEDSISARFLPRFLLLRIIFNYSQITSDTV